MGRVQTMKPVTGTIRLQGLHGRNAQFTRRVQAFFRGMFPANGPVEFRIRVDSKSCGFACRIRWIRVDGRRIRKEKVADSKISGCVWTGPQLKTARETNLIHCFRLDWGSSRRNFVHAAKDVLELQSSYRVNPSAVIKLLNSIHVLTFEHFCFTISCTKYLNKHSLSYKQSSLFDDS